MVVLDWYPPRDGEDQPGRRLIGDSMMGIINSIPLCWYISICSKVRIVMMMMMIMMMMMMVIIGMIVRMTYKAGFIVLFAVFYNVVTGG